MTNKDLNISVWYAHSFSNTISPFKRIPWQMFPKQIFCLLFFIRNTQNRAIVTVHSDPGNTLRGILPMNSNE